MARGMISVPKIQTVKHAPLHPSIRLEKKKRGSSAKVSHAATGLAGGGFIALRQNLAARIKINLKQERIPRNSDKVAGGAASEEAEPVPGSDGFGA